jgi:hypothetical protein
MKKADLSINTIIIAALAIIVLVVVILIFTNNMLNFRVSSQKCENFNGRCVSADVCQNWENGNFAPDETDVSGFIWKKADYGCFDSDKKPTGEVCCVRT